MEHFCWNTLTLYLFNNQIDGYWFVWRIGLDFITHVKDRVDLAKLEKRFIYRRIDVMVVLGVLVYKFFLFF